VYARANELVIGAVQAGAEPGPELAEQALAQACEDARVSMISGYAINKYMRAR
jgi:hypothetical protein